jgi:anthranilate synthase component I
MTDPFDAFAHRAEGASVAGYFERAGAGPAALHDAAWFADADDLLTLRERSAPGELREWTRRRLRGHPEGGLFGYLGFDAVGLFEPALRSAPGGSPFPLGEVAFARRPYRHRFPPRPSPVSGADRPTPPPRSDSLGPARYELAVRRLIEEIRDGESYQVVLAHRREWRRPPDLLERAARLRATERFAFFYYLRFGGREVLGAAPESVVEVAGRTATLNPIAGTLPHRDRPRRRPLAVDPKELSEHRMLVDLARNDLGRLAVPGSVHLPFRERRERYARLDHLVSRVSATLPSGIGPWEVLASAFPAGTVSGAPKIRATQLLRREEATWRGPYGGTVGYLDAHRADFALTIRSAFAAGDRLFTAAGAGIVHRSRPRQEWEETLAKLAHVESNLVGSPT